MTPSETVIQEAESIVKVVLDAIQKAKAKGIVLTVVQIGEVRIEVAPVPVVIQKIVLRSDDDDGEDEEDQDEDDDFTRAAKAIGLPPPEGLT